MGDSSKKNMVIVNWKISEVCVYYYPQLRCTNENYTILYEKILKEP